MSRDTNFYYSFLCLPAQKRASMCAIYAFMRYSDDISDDGHGDRPARMEAWRAALDGAPSLPEAAAAFALTRDVSAEQGDVVDEDVWAR